MIKILILEDNPGDAKLMELELKKNGILFTSTRVETREEFTRALTEFKPSIILADSQLPDFDGMSALAIIKEKNLNIPFILVSGTMLEESIIETIKKGATDFIVKSRLFRLGPALVRAVEQDTTQKKGLMTEKALQQSQYLIQRIAETNPGVTFLYDLLTARIFYANKRLREILGYSSDELIERSAKAPEKIFHPDDFADHLMHFEKLKKDRTDSVYETEFRIKHANGEWRWVLARDMVFARGADGTPYQGIGVAFDITQRKKTEAALQESERMLRRVTNHIEDVLWLSSPDFKKFMYVSPAYEKVWGRNCESLYQDPQGFFETIHPEDKVLTEVLMTSSTPKELVFRIIRPDGSYRWVKCRVRPLYTPNGEFNQKMGIATDITEKRAAEMLRSRLAAIVNFTDDAIMSTNLDGIIISWNRSAERIFGYTAEEMIGQPLSCLYPPDRLQEHDEIFNRIKKGETVSQFETVQVRRDKSRFHYSLTVSPIKDEQGQLMGASAIGQDISERRRLEEEILRASELEQRRIGQDLHDTVCQNLTGISFLTKVVEKDLTKKSAPEVPQVQEILDLLEETTSLTRSLARGLVAVSPEINGLKSALEEYANQVKKMFKVHCQIRYDDSIEFPNPSHAIHLFRIVQEAVANAIKHGKATIIQINVKQDNNLLELAISDNGDGIKGKLNPQGMGLRIMEYRANLMGGTFSVARGPQNGTAVSCRLKLDLNKPLAELKQ